jgi:hypothetical protein
MARPLLAVVGVALLVATAGCSGFLGSGGTDRETYEVPDPTPTATQTPTATPGVTERVSRGMDAKLRSQAEILRNAGNYTVRQVRNATTTGTIRLVERTERVDVTRDRIVVYNRYELSRGYEQANQTFYQDGRGIWDRLNRTDEAVEYRNWSSESPGSAVESSLETLDRLGHRLAEVDLEPSGGARFDGKWMLRLTASDPDSAVLSTQSAKHHYLTVYVDDRGLVRYVEETVVRDDSGRQVRTVRFEVVDPGTTTVREPDWVGNVTGR